MHLDSDYAIFMICLVVYKKTDCRRELLANGFVYVEPTPGSVLIFELQQLHYWSTCLDVERKEKLRPRSSLGPAGPDSSSPLDVFTRVGARAPVYLAVVMKYFELAGNASHDNKKTRIIPRHLSPKVESSPTYRLSSCPRSRTTQPSKSLTAT